jgi:hypothetical protein
MTIQVDQFWNKVKVKEKEDCWVWLGAKDSCGYGKITFNNKTISAHRFSYDITYGPIPKGMQILHKCDNPECVNPNHLYCGTHGDNMSDMVARHTYDPIQIGLPSTKLYAGEIWLIRKLRIIIGGYTHKMYRFPSTYIAKMFKVDKATILRIWKSDKWLCKEGYYV